MTPEQLRASILQYAMEGKLVKQDPNDEPASVLLDKIKAEKEKLIQKGKISKEKKVKPISQSEKSSHLPSGWSYVRFQNISLFTTDYVANGSFKTLREHVHRFKNKNYAVFVRTMDLSADFTKDLVYIDKKSYDFLNKSKLFGGELILPNIGGSIGKAFLMPDLGMPMSLAPNSIMVKFIDPIMNKFFSYFIGSLYGKKILLGNKGGTATPKFSKTELRNAVIMLPPLEEQKRIVAKIDKLMSLVDKYAETYNRLQKIDGDLKEKLKQSILQYAMEGKLVPQNFEDEPASVLLEKIKAKKQELIKEGKIKKSKMLPPIADDEKPFNIPESWEWVRLKNVTTFGNFVSVKGLEIPNGSWVVDMKDIKKDGGGFQSIVKKTSSNIYKSNKYKFSRNTVLYGKLRPYLRKVEVTNSEGYTTTEMLPIKAIGDFGLNIYYLRYVFLSPYFVKMVNDSMYGMKMPRVGTIFLSKMPLPLPPLEEQQRIVNKIQRIFRQINKKS